MAAYNDDDTMQCPKCASTNMQRRGTTVTQTGRYHRLQCQDCGGWGRTRYTTNSKDKRHSLLSN